MYRLTQTNENNFTKKLDEWHAVYKVPQGYFLRAFFRNKYKDFEIPNTTLKILIKVHRGLGKSLKLKIVDDYLLNYRKKK